MHFEIAKCNVSIVFRENAQVGWCAFALIDTRRSKDGKLTPGVDLAITAFATTAAVLSILHCR
jgi:hypothetical protein